MRRFWFLWRCRNAVMICASGVGEASDAAASTSGDVDFPPDALSPKIRLVPAAAAGFGR